MVQEKVHVEWWRSPRIIMIEAPLTTISVQDLVDTCRALEDDLDGLDDDALIDATGKQVLSGSIRVGITVTLLNAQVAFESRDTANSTGVATAIGTTDGLPGTILTNTTATFITDGVKTGHTILNTTDKSLTCIIEVLSETQLKHYPLQNGILNIWSIGDAYQIFPSVSCTITGGNVVAIDNNGDPISALSNTTFVNTVLELSTSASIAVSGSGVTPQDKTDIATLVWEENLANHTVYSSSGRILSSQDFNQKIIVDEILGSSGTIFPKGTALYPVNNLNDAFIIGENQGIFEYSIIGEATSSRSYNNKKFSSPGNFNNNILHLAGFTYTNTLFKDLTVTGTLAGSGNQFIDCYLTNLNNLSGEAISCRLHGLLKIHGNSIFSGIELVVEGDTTTIDLQNIICTVSLDINSGVITFINAVAGCLIELNLKGGEVFLDASCVGGEYYMEGIGNLYNSSTMTKKDNHLLSLEEIPPMVWKALALNNKESGSIGELLFFLKRASLNNVTKFGNVITIYEEDGITPWKQFNLADGGRIEV